jgi:acetate kinase
VRLTDPFQVFLEYLPSSIGSDSSTASLVLQKTLETYFRQYFAKMGDTDISKIIYERGANEAMKLLVRSYLSQLQILQLKEDTSKREEMSSR